jgi:tetratricopeptide (TPR) repeat protein
LRKLATVRSARILISTRLYPANLQTETGMERSGCAALFLHGLSDDDALNLWRAFGISGSREALLPLFHTFDNHPLLIQVLAGEIAHDRRTPGDFDQWRKNHPDFNPFSLPLVQVKSHVLACALRGLDDTTLKVLDTIAAFRMPAAYDTLVALFIGEGKPCPSETALIAILADLEDRGLLGWDRRANRYDLHPIVRGVTWAGLGNQARQGIYQTLSTHFESLPTIDDWQDVESLEDLTSAIELYNTLIGLNRYDDASVLFRDRLSRALLYRFGTSRQRIELLEMLFPDGLDQLPRLSDPYSQAYMLHDLALSVRVSGLPGLAAVLYRRSLNIYEEIGNQLYVSVNLYNLSYALRFSGALYESEVAACQALLISRQLSDQGAEAISLQYLGLALTMRGKQVESAQALDRSLALALQVPSYSPYDSKATRALWFGDYTDAQLLANEAMAHGQQQRFERGIICAARLQGEAALGMDNLVTAEERLHHALTSARAVNLIEEELPTLIGLSELQRRQRDLNAARELLEDVWEPAERGPFKLFHADAYNVLVQIERDAGDHAAAAKAATMAYRLAWCDGPPFAYHWGLQKAKAHLSALGEPEPALPPFDASKFEPMPQIEIDPLADTEPK